MNRPYYGGPQRTPSQGKKQDMFDEFDATELFCPTCCRSMPVRKRLLLVLPEGEKYEYVCRYCATSVGMKIAREKEPKRLII